MKTRSMAVLLSVAVCLAQPAEDQVELKDRIWIASKTYATVRQYFGHWQAVPDLDLDAAYRRYVEKVVSTGDRLAFGLATMEFVATLRNGHTDFSDGWLWKEHGQPNGYWLDRIDGKWVVRDSVLEGLETGAVVTAIEGQGVQEFLDQRGGVVSASDDETRRRRVCLFSFVWPKAYTLTLAGGRTYLVNRTAPKWKARPQPAAAPKLPGGVAYHRIRSFEEPRFEQAAIEFVRQNANAELIIFDVRGNGGGSSPEQLLRAIMDRPYRDWMQASAMSIGLFATYGQLLRQFGPSDDPRLRGYLEGFAEYFERPYFMTPGMRKMPENPLYRGRLYVLQDRNCGSACEDFLMPLKTTGRATTFGERTFGSSGQPHIVDFGRGMRLRVSTKRMYLPDGSEFEGVGIKPEIEVVTPPAAATDTVLEAALAHYAKR